MQTQYNSPPKRMDLEGTSTAIILGATGLTGGILFRKLLKDSGYGKILLFSRNAVVVKNDKIEEHILDLLNLKEQKEFFKADDVFCCIGTTKRKTPHKRDYIDVDFGIPATAAKLCRENGIENFIVMSALGASAESSIFYNRTKGEMEEEVLAQKIKNTCILQPSLIAGERDEARTMEKMAKYTMEFLNPLLMGPLKKYRSIHAEKIAVAMIYVAKNGCQKKRIKSDEINEIANKAIEKGIS